MKFTLKNFLHFIMEFLTKNFDIVNIVVVVDAATHVFFLQFLSDPVCFDQIIFPNTFLHNSKKLVFHLQSVFKNFSKDLPVSSLQHWPSRKPLDFQVHQYQYQQFICQATKSDLQVYQHIAHVLYKSSSNWIEFLAVQDSSIGKLVSH